MHLTKMFLLLAWMQSGFNIKARDQNFTALNQEVLLRRTGKNNSDKIFLEKLGESVQQEILNQGYKSAYDFWQKKAQGHLSKTTLTYLIRGHIDPKVTTLGALARLLGVDIRELLKAATSEPTSSTKKKKSAHQKTKRISTMLS